MSPPRTYPWKAIYDEHKDAIDQGKLDVGDAIETEQQLVDRHGVGRDAVRRALANLQSHGLITAPGPHGRVVARFDPRTWNLSRFEIGHRRDIPEQGIDEWAADMKEQGCEPTEHVEVDNLRSPVRVAKFLGVAPRTWLYRRRRFRYTDGELVSIADTWVPEWLAKSPAISENGDEMRDDVEGGVLYPFKVRRSISLPGGLIRAVGMHQEWVEDLHYSRHPSPDEAELLGATEPVAEVVRVGYDSENQPFRAMITVSPGHRLAARYVLRVGGNEE